MSMHLSKQEGEREKRELHAPDVGDDECGPELRHSAET